MTGPTGSTPVTPGATGTAGYLQHGNIIDNFGSVVATTAGVTGNFAKPYVNAPPFFTLGGVTGPTGGQPYVSAISLTGLVIKTQSGAATVNYRAIGS
jgi:hypothetical protein